MEHTLQAQTNMVYTLYPFLAAVNLYYLLGKIWKLEYKTFHLTIFIILQIGYAS